MSRMKWNGAALRALLGAAALLTTSNAAFAAPVYLTCTNVPPSGFSRYLTIDYSTNTVVTSDFNVTTPYPDSAGNTVIPAQVSDSQIVWQIVTKRANNLNYAEHFTLNRLSGSLSYYDDGTQHGEAWTCQIAAKPTPKF